MNGKFSSISEYLVWIFKKYLEIERVMEYEDIYRIVAIKDATDTKDTINAKEVKFLIQIIGTDKIVEWFPEEIVLNNQILAGFSKNDIRTITYYACNKLNNPNLNFTPNLSIKSYEFSEKIKRIFFHIINRKTGETFKKTASDFMKDQEIVTQFSPQDMLRVGYTAGIEQAEQEKEAMKKLKEAHQK